jgi:hypothetical protein
MKPGACNRYGSITEFNSCTAPTEAHPSLLFVHELRQRVEKRNHWWHVEENTPRLPRSHVDTK